MNNNKSIVYEQGLDLPKNKNMINKIKTLFKHLNKYFIISFIIIFISIVFKYPSLSIHSEIFAEMGTDFLQNALYKTVFENFWDVVYVYAMLLPRVITILLVKVFEIVNNFPIAAQFMSITLISFFASVLNLNVFRKIIYSDKIRFILSISLGLVADYQLNSFIYFTYFGIIFCSLMFFVNKEKLKFPYYLGALLLNSLLLASKAQYIVMLPIILCFLIYSIIKNNKKSIIFYLVSITAVFYQLFVMVFLRTEWRVKGAPTTIISIVVASINSIIGLLNSYVSYILSFEPLRLFLKYNLNYTNLRNIIHISSIKVYILIFLIGIILLLTLVTVTYSFIKLYQKNEKKTLIIFVLCNLIAFGTLMLFTMSYFPGSKSLHLITVGKNRAHYFVAFFIYFGIVTLFSKSFEIKAITSKIIKIGTIIVLALMFLEPLVSFYTPGIGGDPYSNSINSYSQWETYDYLLTYEDYCIPINPYPWIMSLNCYELNPNINFTSNIRVDTLNLNKYFKNQNQILLRAIMIENDNITPLNEPFVIALNQKGEELGKAKLLTNKNNKYLYFLFEEKVSPNMIILVNQNRTIAFYPKIKLFGTIESNKNNYQNVYSFNYIANTYPYLEIYPN